MAYNTRINYLSFCILFFLSTSAAIGQNKKIDRLEQYYDQGHYKMVYRRASRLLKSTENNNSVLPSYYRAMSSFQLMRHHSWFKRNNTNLKESISFMNEAIQSSQWSQIMESHSNELTAMEVLFDMWLANSNNQINEEERKLMEDWILTVYRGYEFELPQDEYRDEEGLIPEGLSMNQRTNLVHYAYEFMGIPYKWGGIDENGFDCSGFTRHVFQNIGIELPRVSKDQFNYSKKINEKRAFLGDLVFFSEGNGISHVGILVNQIKEPKKMIHSSSSLGISVVDIESSNYWKSRIVGYRRVIK